MPVTHLSNSPNGPLKTSNNNMNSKINKRLDRVPENLGPNGVTPSGKPRLFVCNTCTRAFARHEHLKRHERSHTKEKPFHCGVCQRKFSRRDLLLRHAQKLHAGCDDAIKRLRRRTSRSKSIASEADQNIEINQGFKKIRLENSFDIMDTQHDTQQVNQYFSNGLQFENHSSNSYSNDAFKSRRTSFSAASANNYASASSTLQHSVEFSTPQLLPVDHLNGNSHYEANFNINQNQPSLNSWTSDINNIPGLDFLSNFSLNEDNISTKDSSELDSLSPITKVPSKRKKSSSRLRKANSFNSNDIFGYSFYDDNYQLSNETEEFNNNHNNRLTFPKLPSTYLNDFSTSTTTPDHHMESCNSSLNLNDYELLNDLEVPNHEEKILSVGYSFYESNDFASTTINPKRSSNELSHHNLEDFGNHSNHNDLFHMDNNNNHGDDEDDDMISLPDIEMLSTRSLFTNLLSNKISKVLMRYPFVGLLPPKLPDLNKLDLFVQNFKTKFLHYHPFIHKNYLNEKSMFEYTFNEATPDDPTPHVCLPLLIATIGALYSNDKRSAADLYEISRRCIHVYLDSRKQVNDFEKSTTHNSPLWLVQSLVLSVIYGLFAESEESDLSIILRQVNALSTLIRVSKFNLVKFNLENIEINDEYFKDYILYQSKIRTVYMIYNVSNLLTAIYNIAPFIKYKELKCDLPDLENYWNCSNVEEFKVKCVENSSINYNLNLEKIFNDVLTNSPINYKVSEYGANIVMFTILQHFYFNKNNRLMNSSLGIQPSQSNTANLINNFKWKNLLIGENPSVSIMLKNISVIRSLLIDISKVKEMLWIKDWDNLSKEFVALNCKDEDLLDACAYSIRTISFIFINDEYSSNFKNSLSLSFQFLVFNFFHIAKFLYKFERKIFRHFNSECVLKSNELKEIPKYFSIYLKIAKFLADLEQIFIKNFNYNDVDSKLALKDFDKTRFNFGVFPKLHESEYPKEVNLEQVLKVVKLKLSSNILKIGSFIFKYVFEQEMAFNIFKNLSDALIHIKDHIEKERY